MRIRFYLKRPIPGPKASKETKALYKKAPHSESTIFALVNYGGNTLKVYTGESINPKFWNPATQQARATPLFIESPEFNQRLNNIRGTINRVFLDYRNRHDHASPSVAILKPLIEAALKKGVQSHNFLTYFDDFVSRSNAGQRIDPKTRKPVGKGVTRGYQTTLNHLEDFSKTWRRKLDFETIDLEFHNDFTKFLIAAPRLLSANTVGSHFQRIKAVLAEATERGINTSMGFKSKYFIKQTEEADTIYLNEAELNEMRGIDLSGNPRLDNIRDLFLIGCFTGLRFSDFSILKPENIADGFIRINQIKTGAPVIIPVHSVVKAILKKHKGETPRTISNAKLNQYLKELGQLLPSLKDKTEQKNITKGGLQEAKTVKKWQLLTTHTARRSFATNEFNAGTPSLTIMAITGHKTEKSFLKYIRVTPDEHAQKIKEIWASREQKAKLKVV